MPKIEAEKESTTYNFLSSALSLIFVPISAYLSDRYCWHSNFGMIAPLITQISFFLYMSLHPLIPTIFYSIGFSLNYTAVWSNISLCVENNHMVIKIDIQNIYYKIGYRNGFNIFIAKCCIAHNPKFNSVYTKTIQFL